MSDHSEGEGWWQASDDKWYPPESHPGYRPAPPPPVQPQPDPAFAGWATGATPSPMEPPPAGAKPIRPWWRRPSVVIGALVVVLVAIAIAVKSGSGGSGKRELTGEFALTDSSDAIGEGTSDCEGTDGYDDFGPNMDVTVRNGDGKIIATTNTVSMSNYDGGDIGPDVIETAAEATYGSRYCVVFWSVDVPANEDFYEVETGHRGQLHYTHQQMVDQDWHVAASLGG